MQYRWEQRMEELHESHAWRMLSGSRAPDAPYEPCPCGFCLLERREREIDEVWAW